MKPPRSGASRPKQPLECAAADLNADRERALQLTPVSRETLARLDRFAALLLDWQRVTNLVAASTLSKLWTRHIADSLQLLELVPTARVLVDFGSGAGFPGLILACGLAEKPGTRIILVEANQKKAAFLRQAIAVTGAPALVRAERIAAFVQSYRERADVVTARALAPLDVLLAQAEPLLKNGAQALFPKGQDVEAELTVASRYWNLDAVLVPSKTDPRGRMVHIRRAARRP